MEAIVLWQMEHRASLNQYEMDPSDQIPPSILRAIACPSGSLMNQ